MERSDDLPGYATQGQPIEGVYSVQRVTFCNEDTGYAVVYLVPADRPIEVGFAAVGSFGQPRTGECYRIAGTWHRDPRHGLQVKVAAAMPQAPRDIPAIERYLAGATIKGLGPHYARALVEHFGEETFEELQRGGLRLEEVPGIGPVRARAIRESWAEHEGRHQLMLKLQGIARLSPRQAERVHRQYGQEAWEVISRNPFRLADEVRGFGFRTADRIASHLGMAPDAPERIQAGLIHLLNQQLEDGHLWATEDAAAEGAAELLSCDADAVAPQIDALVAQGRLIREVVELDGDACRALYLPHVRHTEQRLAEGLARFIACAPRAPLGLPPERALEMVARTGHRQLTDEQRRAVAAVLGGTRLSILTGGPGTGKTTTLRSLIDCLEVLGVTYALCATTGRASKQLAASTGRAAATVHRHLRIGFGAALEPVRETVLVVDESSMIDLWLMHEIAQRLTDASYLVLVGDVDQLPSVGPGAILQDLIALGERGDAEGIAVTRLTHIFRQEAGDRSMIVVNCHRVRRGRRPVGEVPKTSDYFEMLREDPAEARELVVDLAARRLPGYLGVPPHEVQVLTPMHGGPVGTQALNDALQRLLNPPGPGKAEHALSGVGGSAGRARVLRTGDKVRQTRNNYQKQVLNGDLGVVQSLDPQNQTLTVRFDDRSASYTFDELDELVHAWAMTVHSAQGSQWPAVVVVMLTNHYVMLDRNILYTALSRAERLAVLVTQERAVRLAVAQDRSTRRRTALPHRLAAARLAPGTVGIAPGAGEPGRLQPRLC